MIFTPKRSADHPYPARAAYALTEERDRDPIHKIFQMIQTRVRA
jgi:hypothetical protein